MCSNLPPPPPKGGAFKSNKKAKDVFFRLSLFMLFAPLSWGWGGVYFFIQKRIPVIFWRIEGFFDGSW